MNSLLAALDDDTLLSTIRTLVARSNADEADLILHLGEMDERRLYAPLGYSSMHAYCTGVLGFSQYTAFDRINVARLVRRRSGMLELLRDGKLNLTALRLLSSAMMREDCSDQECQAIAARAFGLVTEQVRELAAELAPKPAVPDSIRKVPTRGAPPPPPPAVELPLLATAAPQAPAPVSAVSAPPPPSPPTPPRVEPLAPDAYKVTFTADAELRQLLREAEELLSHRKDQRNLPSIVKAAVKDYVAKLKKERFGLGAKPRAARPEAAPPKPATRHVPVAMARETVERRGLRCTFVSDDGHRCGERAFLQIEHVEGFARTGEHSPETLDVHCATHNLLAAERMFGREFMDRKRRGTRFKTSATQLELVNDEAVAAST